MLDFAFECADVGIHVTQGTARYSGCLVESRTDKAFVGFRIRARVSGVTPTLGLIMRLQSP